MLKVYFVLGRIQAFCPRSMGSIREGHSIRRIGGPQACTPGGFSMEFPQDWFNVAKSSFFTTRFFILVPTQSGIKGYNN